MKRAHIVLAHYCGFDSIHTYEHEHKPPSIPHDHSTDSRAPCDGERARPLTNPTPISTTFTVDKVSLPRR